MTRILVIFTVITVIFAIAISYAIQDLLADAVEQWGRGN